MPPKKGANKKPKPGKPRARVARRAVRSAGNANAMQMQLMRYINPWMGKGTKWPDSNGAYSITASLVTRFNIVPVSGYAAVRIYPGNFATMFFNDPTLDGSGYVTDWGTGLPCNTYSGFVDSMEGVRLVSAGVKIKYIGNSFNNGGNVYAASMPVKSHTTTTKPTRRVDQAPHFVTFPLKKSEFKWIATRSGVEAEHYDLPAQAVDDNWSSLTLFFYGADSTTPQAVEIEVTQNVEMLPPAASGYSLLASPAAPASVQTTQYVQNAQLRGGPFR